MLTIQIKNWDNEVIATVNNIYNLQVDEEVNKWCKLKLRFPVEAWLQKRPIEKADRISVVYSLKIWKVVRIFEGYITDITLKTTEVTIEADNWLAYLQFRIIRSAKNYENRPINQVISEIFNELNTTYSLPIYLWRNDCDTLITKEFSVWESFFDILKYCRENENQLVVRIRNDNWKNYLDCMKWWWQILEWVWEFDVNFTKGTNIIDWERKDSMNDFITTKQTAWWIYNNQEFIENKNLIFEQYEEEWTSNLPNWKAIPSVSVSRDTDRRDFYVWDRKNIRLNTWYDWLELEYLWLIQWRKLTINAQNDVKAEIKISEEYKADKNILDLILQNLRTR